jgi:hypothetical protein
MQIMDVMVIYTPQAYDYFNNDSPTVQAFIDLAVQMTNDAYVNSGISLRMRLVRGAEVQDASFTETDFNTDLSKHVCIYIYIYMYMYICMSMDVRVYLYMYEYGCAYEYICAYIYMSMIYVCIYLHIYVYTYMYMYVCM